MNNIIVEQAAEKFKAPQPMPSIPADIKAATAEEEEESEDEEVCFLFLRGKICYVNIETFLFMLYIYKFINI